MLMGKLFIIVIVALERFIYQKEIAKFSETNHFIMKGKKRNNAVGVKGKSGRKSAIDELKITKLKNICVDFAIKEMEDPEISADVKRTTVFKVLSLLPRETDITSNGETITPIYAGKSIQGYSSNPKDIQSEEKD